MNIPKEAIKKAIKSGWYFMGNAPIYDETLHKVFRVDGDGGYLEIYPEQIVCDPTFWQALGRALGWDDQEALEEYKGVRRYVPGWEINGEEFLHLILTQQSTEEFWKEKLNSKV